MVMYGVNSTFGVFFKPLSTDLAWTRAMTSGAFSLSWIVHGSLSIVIGGLTDRFDPRIVLTICGVLLGLGYLLMSQISTVWQLYLFYGVVIGTGLSGGFITLMPTIAKWFVKRRSMVTGIVLAGSGIGTLIAPPIANQLISIYDWRLSYIILGGMALVLVVSAAQFLRRDPTQKGQMPYGESEGEEKGLKFETKAFSLKKAVSTRQFWLVFIMFFGLGYGASTVMVHIVPHATDLGISAASAANILAIFGGLSVIGRVVLGIAGDKIGNRQVLIIGFALIAAASFYLMPATDTWALYLFAAVFGFAFGGCVASESPIVAVLFGLSSHGLILGVIVLGFSIGAAIGSFVTGYIFDIAASYQVAFLVCAAISVVALISTVILTPTKTS
ncbi:L-lactate transporter [subsurface metagenome]